VSPKKSSHGSDANSPIFGYVLRLLAHSTNFIELTLLVINREIFLVRLFCTPSPTAPEATAPSARWLHHWGPSLLW